MDTADGLAQTDHRTREIQYRDGLIIALFSLWPVRRRSIAALTVTRHLQIDGDGITILLFPEDTKSKRAERFRVPDTLLPYLRRYLEEIRPRLAGNDDRGALWPSYRRRPLTGDHTCVIVRVHIHARFDKLMALHDFRRAAATFLATNAPDKIGLIPGVKLITLADGELGELHVGPRGTMNALFLKDLA